MQLNDGTFLFDNFWGDTIVIKTQAYVGDSWTFCHDSSTLYYIATVSDIDTMTVLGHLDSVKKIVVSAHNASGVVSSDPVNGAGIFLSKNYGFVQALNLYTFPYHLAGGSYIPGLDYYTDASMRQVYGMPVPLDLSSIIFKIISYTNPNLKELYSWNIGDVYQYSFHSPIFPALTFYKVTTDTVIGKTMFIDTVVYTCSEATTTAHGSFIYDFTTSDDIRTNMYTSATFIDSLMPEESGQSRLYFYNPADSQYCIAGAIYEFLDNYLTNTNVYRGAIFGTYKTIYKMPLGLVYDYGPEYEDGAGENFSTTLTYYSKSGISCGEYNYLETSTPLINKSIVISPNPATNLITVTTGGTITNIKVDNVIGQSVYAHPYNAQYVQVDIKDLPAGVYFIRINGTEIRRFIKQ